MRYDNQYCMVWRIENGRIKEIKEYCDSALVERVLGPFPQKGRVEDSRAPPEWRGVGSVLRRRRKSGRVTRRAETDGQGNLQSVDDDEAGGYSHVAKVTGGRWSISPGRSRAMSPANWSARAI